MKCPKDGTLLQSVEVDGVVLDKCHTCDGIWCDHGEIERLKGLRKHRPEAEVEARYGNPAVREDTVAGYMVCPRCGKRLHRYRYTFARNVMVDRCENAACYGIWLEKGELDAVLEELKELDGIGQRRTEGGLAVALAAFLGRFTPEPAVPPGSP